MASLEDKYGEAVADSYAPTTSRGMRRDVGKALLQAWRVTHLVDSPDLVAALAQRTRNLQDGGYLQNLSGDVQESLDLHAESMSRAMRERDLPGMHLPADGRLVCSREVIVGAVGAADWHASMERRARRDFMINEIPAEQLRHLFDYWKLQDNLLQALCLRPGERKELLPAYNRLDPWPRVSKALHPWSAALGSLACGP